MRTRLMPAIAPELELLADVLEALEERRRVTEKKYRCAAKTLTPTRRFRADEEPLKGFRRLMLLRNSIMHVKYAHPGPSR